MPGKFGILEKYGVRNSALGILDLLFYIGSLSAFIPVTRYKDKTGYYVYIRCKAKWTNMTPLTVMTIVCISLPILLYKYEYEPLEKKTTCDILIIVASVGEGVCVVSTIVVLFMRQDYYLQAYYTLCEVDKIFRSLKIYFSYNFLNVFTLFMQIAVIISVIAVPILKINDRKSMEINIVETFTFYGGYQMRQGPIYFYFYLTILITMRMWHLNERITGLDVTTMTREEIREELRLIGNLHHKLVDASDGVNASYSVSVLGILLQTTLMVMLFILSLYENYYRRDEFGFWPFQNVLPSWMLVLMCQYALYEANRTPKLLSGLDLPIDEDMLYLELTNVLLQIKHRSVSFNAAGLFDIEASLLVLHLGTVANFVLFLLSLTSFKDAK